MLSIVQLLLDRGDVATLMSVMDAVQPVDAELAFKGAVASIMRLLDFVGGMIR